VPLDVDRLTAQLEVDLASHGVPAFALAVVEGAEIPYTFAFGRTRIGSDLPVTVDTPFYSGSISKTITALAVMRLVELGAVELDVPVAEYVRDLRFSRDDYAHGITLRRLLSHSSGLFGTASNYGDPDPRSLLRFAKDAAHRAPFVAPPGVAFEYSSVGIDIAGAAIESVTGRFFADAVAELLFQPLGLAATYDHGGVHDRLAMPHVLDAEGVLRVQQRLPNAAAANPAGNVICSTRALAQLAALLLGNGGPELLTGESLSEMLRPQISLRDGKGGGYGLGLWTLVHGDVEWVTHAGLLHPYSCELSVFPGLGIGVAFQCSAPGSFDPYAVRRSIVDAHVDERTARRVRPRERDEDERSRVPVPGRYFSMAAGFATLEHAGDALVLGGTRDAVREELHHLGGGIWSNDAATTTLGVISGHDDRYFILDEHVYERFAAESVTPLAEDALRGYVGTYRFDDGDTAVARLLSGSLMLSFSWFGDETTCIPVGDDCFATEFGLIRFRRSNGIAVALEYEGFVPAHRVGD
jgi:CubicO group peptidase (beta-lactamase class C family)